MSQQNGRSSGTHLRFSKLDGREADGITTIPIIKIQLIYFSRTAEFNSFNIKQSIRIKILRMGPTRPSVGGESRVFPVGKRDIEFSWPFNNIQPRDKRKSIAIPPFPVWQF